METPCWVLLWFLLDILLRDLLLMLLLVIVISSCHNTLSSIFLDNTNHLVLEYLRSRKGILDNKMWITSNISISYNSRDIEEKMRKT